MNRENLKIISVFCVIALLYLLFPTNNSTLDAFNYAACVKYSQNLFSPHHLLYIPFLEAIYHFVEPFSQNIDVLAFCKIVNSFFVIAILILVFRVFIKLKLKKNEIINLLLIIAFSYNFLRFGTENETYIIPIFFSLLGSLYFLHYLQRPSLIIIFFSGLFTAVACLFHQIHIFWWLALLFGVLLYVKNKKVLFLYVIPAIIVPIVYILVLTMYCNQPLSRSNFLYFVLHDYYTGSADSELGLLNIILIVISSIRAFIQVHPNVILLIRNNIIFCIPILVAIYWMSQTILMVWDKTFIKKRADVNIVFIKTLLIALCLHLIFAFYAVGNLESLVMLPLLLVMTFFYYFEINKNFLMLTAATLLLWNFMYGIFPNYNYKFQNDTKLVNVIIQTPKASFLVQNPAVVNKYYYRTGVDNYEKIILKKQLQSTKSLDSLLKKNRYLYTDIIDKPTVFNRSQIVNEDKKINFKRYKLKKVYEYKSFYGVTKIYKVRR